MSDESGHERKEQGTTVKHIFIINPSAGKANAVEKLIPQIRAAQAKLGVQAEILTTEYSGHAIELARAAVQCPEDVRLYACGGDGTLNEVLCGAYQARGDSDGVEIGHIPCGSGNDMIRNFGSASEFSDLERMMLAGSRKIDLIEANGRVAASICAVGLDAKVAYNIPIFRRLPLCGGSIAYDLAVFKCLLGKLDYHLTVECEEGCFEDDFILAAIGNGSYYGGGYCSLPNALVDDGLLNVVLVKKMPLLRIPPLLSRYKAGTHFAPNGEIAEDLKDVMVSLSTRTIRVRCDREFFYTADGECARTKQVDVKILPGAVRFILPYSAGCDTPGGI